MGLLLPLPICLVHHVDLLGCQVYESQAVGKLGRGGRSSGLSCAGTLAQEPLLLKPAEKPASVPFQWAAESLPESHDVQLGTQQGALCGT